MLCLGNSVHAERQSGGERGLINPFMNIENSALVENSVTSYLAL